MPKVTLIVCTNLSLKEIGVAYERRYKMGKLVPNNTSRKVRAFTEAFGGPLFYYYTISLALHGLQPPLPVLLVQGKDHMVHH